jgi:hypothetical protein
MITGIASSGKYMYVHGGTSMPYVNSNGLCAGNVRFNTNTRTLEVYDGTTWIAMSSTAQVGLSPEAESLLDWARQKRDEEYQLQELAKTNPTIADLLDQIKEKQEQIRVVRNLTELEVKVA